KNADDVLPFVSTYRYDTQENVVVLTLSGAHEIINIRLITRGILNNCQIHPREIFAGAIEDRAAAIILVHNHPSGRLEASIEDIAITRKIKSAGELLGITLLDHIIVGPTDGCLSVDDGTEEDTPA
ncbi:MAG: JAB domain-containing protein, partial [Methanocorpusculum sp.]|nr:JAB domain-containing protein [Methanocorpusculum sp.]